MIHYKYDRTYDLTLKNSADVLVLEPEAYKSKIQL